MLPLAECSASSDEAVTRASTSWQQPHDQGGERGPGLRQIEAIEKNQVPAKPANP
jgi:hypothetical protein